MITYEKWSVQRVQAERPFVDLDGAEIFGPR